MSHDKSFLSMRQFTVIWPDMGRPSNPNPTYIYKHPDKARIYYRGEFRDLPGKYQSPESIAAYHEMCLHVQATGQLPQKHAEVKHLTISGLVAWWRDYARDYYPAISKQPVHIDYAVRALEELFGSRPAAEFSPVDLKAVRKLLISRGQCRKTVNVRAKQIQFVFKQAVSECLIDQSVWQALVSVQPIGRDRENAIDYEPALPVGLAVFEQTLKHTAPIHAAALRVQLLTGMRSGELLTMRPQDVDISQRHWIYQIADHKTKKHIGPKLIGIPEPAAKILAEHMPRQICDRFFAWSVNRHRKRTIAAIEKAGVKHWYPHQLRHTMSTIAKQKIGLEGAQTLLGHTDTKTTEIYARTTKEAIIRLLDEIEK